MTKRRELVEKMIRDPWAQWSAEQWGQVREEMEHQWSLPSVKDPVIWVSSYVGGAIASVKKPQGAIDDGDGGRGWTYTQLTLHGELRASGDHPGQGELLWRGISQLLVDLGNRLAGEHEALDYAVEVLTHLKTIEPEQGRPVAYMQVLPGAPSGSGIPVHACLFCGTERADRIQLMLTPGKNGTGDDIQTGQIRCESCGGAGPVICGPPVATAAFAGHVVSAWNANEPTPPTPACPCDVCDKCRGKPGDCDNFGCEAYAQWRKIQPEPSPSPTPNAERVARDVANGVNSVVTEINTFLQDMPPGHNMHNANVMYATLLTWRNEFCRYVDSLRSFTAQPPGAVAEVVEILEDSISGAGKEEFLTVEQSLFRDAIDKLRSYRPEPVRPPEPPRCEFCGSKTWWKCGGCGGVDIEAPKPIEPAQSVAEVVAEMREQIASLEKYVPLGGEQMVHNLAGYELFEYVLALRQCLDRLSHATQGPGKVPGEVWLRYPVGSWEEIEIQAMPPTDQQKAEQPGKKCRWKQVVIYDVKPSEGEDYAARPTDTANRTLQDCPTCKGWGSNGLCPGCGKFETMESLDETRKGLVKTLAREMGRTEKVETKRDALQERLDNPGRTQYCVGCEELAKESDSEKRSCGIWAERATEASMELTLEKAARRKAEARVDSLERKAKYERPKRVAIALTMDPLVHTGVRCTVFGTIRQARRFRDAKKTKGYFGWFYIFKTASDALSPDEPTSDSTGEGDESPCMVCEPPRLSDDGYCSIRDTCLTHLAYRAARTVCSWKCKKMPEAEEGSTGRLGCDCRACWFTPAQWLAENREKKSTPINALDGSPEAAKQLVEDIARLSKTGAALREQWELMVEVCRMVSGANFTGAKVTLSRKKDGKAIWSPVK